jgi:hypothetical protein
MNIIDAIKSGKRFKRKVWLHYPAEKTFCATDIVADDWEVESQPVTITREQFDAAWKKVWPHDPYGDGLNSINPYSDVARSALAKELGL